MLVAFATIALALLGRRSAVRYAVAGSLTVLAIGFSLASGFGLVDGSVAVAGAATSRGDHADAAILPAPARSPEAREIVVARVVSALAAAPGLADAVRIRLAEHESPPAAGPVTLQD